MGPGAIHMSEQVELFVALPEADRVSKVQGRMVRLCIIKMSFGYQYKTHRSISERD